MCWWIVTLLVVPTPSLVLISSHRADGVSVPLGFIESSLHSHDDFVWLPYYYGTANGVSRRPNLACVVYEARVYGYVAFLLMRTSILLRVEVCCCWVREWHPKRSKIWVWLSINLRVFHTSNKFRVLWNVQPCLLPWPSLIPHVSTRIV